MPLALLFVGVVLVVTGVRGTTEQLGGLVKGDFTGPNNFTAWLAALIIAGALGYVPGFKPVAYAFLLLILVVIILRNGNGFFDHLRSDLKELNQ